MRLAQDSLRVLSDETGGFAVVNRNDFATAFQRIVDDNSSYYVMGYYSTNDRRDGRFRKIEVQRAQPAGPDRARAQGLRRARAAGAGGQAGAPNGASPELRDAIESPLPLAGLPMAMTAVGVQGTCARRARSSCRR